VRFVAAENMPREQLVLFAHEADPVIREIVEARLTQP
jgi:hypothetical protein